jgi:HAD superfamily 5'-nucleotidase-like hydrolase
MAPPTSAAGQEGTGGHPKLEVPPRANEIGVHSLVAHLLAEQGVQLAPERERQVFCNRSLRLEDIKAVGFDMDYTLATYNQRAIDEVSRACTLANLGKIGYDLRRLRTRIDDEFAIRGLMIDKKLGNVLKMDRHNTVGKAYHGIERLSDSERHEVYRQQRVGDERDRFVFVDTLFELSEVLLFAELVAAIDRGHLGKVKDRPYHQLWSDIRSCTDLAHKDGSLKETIVRNIGDFIERDPELPKTLHRFRSAGKRLFLLTNSELAYTDKVMSYLLPSRADYRDWTSYFDWIIVSASKPGFFTADADFQPAAGGGAPTKRPERGRIWERGNHLDFQRTIGCYPDEVLYVGDHIYHDIVHSKKGCGWRTALVLCELEHDLRIRSNTVTATREFGSLNDAFSQLARRISYHRYLLSLLGHARSSDGSRDHATIDRAVRDYRKRLAMLESHREDLGGYLGSVATDLDLAFNDYWGSIFSEGNDASLFGEQVQDYACIYTGRVTNLLYLSPTEHLHSQPGFMPHF